MQYPVLYVKNVKGSGFKHSSINHTLYFDLQINEENQDPDYIEYIQQAKKEIIDAIIHKFMISLPSKVSNDQETFIIFKDNIDKVTLKQFCNAIIDELNFFTKTKHKALFYETDTMLLQLNKEPSPFKANKVGEKLTKTNFKEHAEVLTGDDKEEDYGIITPFDTYIYLRDQKLKENEDKEEIVEW